MKGLDKITLEGRDKAGIRSRRKQGEQWVGKRAGSEKKKCYDSVTIWG